MVPLVMAVVAVEAVVEMALDRRAKVAEADLALALLWMVAPKGEAEKCDRQ